MHIMYVGLYVCVLVYVVYISLRVFEMAPLHLFCSCKSTDCMYPQYYQTTIKHHSKSSNYFVSLTIQKQSPNVKSQENSRSFILNLA